MPPRKGSTNTKRLTPEQVLDFHIENQIKKGIPVTYKPVESRVRMELVKLARDFVSRHRADPGVAFGEALAVIEKLADDNETQEALIRKLRNGLGT
jgi:hypothetical protein